MHIRQRLGRLLVLVAAALAIALPGGALTVTATATPAAAVTAADCVKQPPAAVPWGSDQVRFCYTSSGALWTNAIPAGSDAMPTHKPNKNRFFANPASMGHLYGEIYGRDASGKIVTRDMTIAYGKLVTDVPSLVNPTSPVNVASYSTAGLKILGGWLAVAPNSFSTKAKWASAWSITGTVAKPVKRYWRMKNLSPVVYETSYVPLPTPVQSASGYCTVKFHQVVSSAYPNAVVKVRYVNRSGVQKSLTLTRVDPLYFEGSASVKCSPTKAGAIARVLGGIMTSS